MEREATNGKASIEALSTVLETAMRLLNDVLRDPLVERFLRVFHDMPAQDRSVLVEALEREVRLRNEATQAGKELVGCELTPNPGARFYMRTFDNTPMPPLTSLSHEAMVFMGLRAARLLPTVLIPGVHEHWRPAMAEAFGCLTPDERAGAEAALLELLDVCRSSAAADDRGHHRAAP